MLTQTLFSSKHKLFQGEEYTSFHLSGGKPAALLIHGFPGTPHEMRPLAQALHQVGWTAEVLLLPGFGADIHTLPDRTYEDWLTAIQDKLDILRRTHSPVMLVGHSMGGALAIVTAAHHPVDGLIVLAPFYRIPHIAWQLLPVLRILIPQIKPFHLVKLDFSNPEVRAGILNLVPDLDIDDPATQAIIKDFTIPVKIINQIRLSGLHAYQAAPSVTCPTLVIQGNRDQLVRPQITHELMKHLEVATHFVAVDGEHDLINDRRLAWEEIKRYVIHFATSEVNHPTGAK